MLVTKTLIARTVLKELLLGNVQGITSVPPVVTGVDITEVIKGDVTQIELTGTDFTQDTVVTYGNEVITNVVITETTITLSLTSSVEGTDILAVTNDDGTSGVMIETLPIPFPTISELSTSTLEEESTVTFNAIGSNLDTTTGIVVSGATVDSYTVNSESNVTITITGVTPSTTAVEITTPRGTATYALTITAIPGPTIATQSSTEYELGQPASITVTGTGYRPDTTATMTRADVTSVTVATDTVFTIYFTPTSEGACGISVANSKGSASTTMTVTPVKVPTISSITPTHGEVDSMTQVVIYGEYLFNGFTISTPSGLVESVTWVNDGSVYFNYTPSVEGPIDVTLTTDRGSVTTSFTADPIPVPTVSSLSPNTTSAYKEVRVLAQGTNFTPTTAVTHANITITDVTYISDTQLEFTAYSEDVGAEFIDFTTNAGSTNKYFNVTVERASTWRDLRAGGDTVTWTSRDGKGTTIANSPTADGTSFTGGIFSSSINISSDQWNRSTPTKVSMILSNAGSHYMAGIGSPNMSANTAQYKEVEIAIWMNAEKVASCWGSTGTLGTGTSITPGSAPYKVGTHTKYVFENNGEAGSMVRIYSIDPAVDDWRHGGTLLTEFTIGGSIAPDEPVLEICMMTGADAPILVGYDLEPL